MKKSKFVTKVTVDSSKMNKQENGTYIVKWDKDVNKVLADSGDFIFASESLEGVLSQLQKIKDLNQELVVGFSTKITKFKKN